MTDSDDRVAAHVARFNAAVCSGDWGAFTDTFTPDARMSFGNVPVGPFIGRDEIAEAYRRQPPTDTMRIDTVEHVNTDVDRIRFTWDHGGPGTMTISWTGGQVNTLEIIFG